MPSPHSGPETELWLYSSLERDHHALPDKTAAAAVAAESACGDLAVAALREVRRIRDRYPDEERRKLPTLLIGGLNNELRCAMANRGVVFPYVTPWDKWMFRVDELPDIDVSGVAGGALPPGMRWDAVRREEIPLVLSRSNIERTEYVHSFATYGLFYFILFSPCFPLFFSFFFRGSC